MATVKKHQFDDQVITKIKDYCRINDISLSKLAKEAGLGNNQIYYLSCGKQIMTMEMYVKICKALKEPLDYFLKEV